MTDFSWIKNGVVTLPEIASTLLTLARTHYGLQEEEEEESSGDDNQQFIDKRQQGPSDAGRTAQRL